MWTPPPRPRSRLKNKNVIFEKLFFYTALFFWPFWAGFFCKIASRENGKNMQVFGCFLCFEEQSRGKGACSRTGYVFILPVGGSHHFHFQPEPSQAKHKKLPHALGQGCVRWRKNAKNIWFFSGVELNVQKT